MKNTLIEWAHHTLNFWWGCAKVSEACRYCYAEFLNVIFGKGRAVWGPSGLRWIREKAPREARALAKAASESGERERVFINSMSDSFEKHDGLWHARTEMLETIEKLTSIDWLLLTKRPELVSAMVPLSWLTDWPAHVWIGTTIESPDHLDRHGWLMALPAAVHFWSVEPMLANIDASAWWTEHGAPQWVICGGESGDHARQMHPAWAQSLRDQCAAFGVPFFFKQWGEWLHSDQCAGAGVSLTSSKRVSFVRDETQDDPRIGYFKFGKKACGRRLDGKEHMEFPAPSQLTLSYPAEVSAARAGE